MERKAETSSSISKHRHKSHGEGNHGESTEREDRIGRLPNAMLCHILSFLETKDAVRTSVLSKLWRKVWTSVPCIDIRYPSTQGFIDFGHRLLRLNTVSCLRKFSIIWSIIWFKDDNQITEWISIVLKRDIEEIILNRVGNGCIQLPPSIFTCKKLVILKVNSKFFFEVPSSVYLPSLKILHICLGMLSSSITNILDGCPVIEELNIRDVDHYYNVNTLFVQSSLLKRFSLHCSYFYPSSGLRVVVDLPNVERLDLTILGNVQYDINDLSSLVNLKTNIWQGSGLVELLRKCTNTKYMEISHETIRRLECQPLDDFPIFHNLTHLIVDSLGHSRRVLRALLECAPNLFTLVFSSSVDMGQSLEEQQHHFKAPKMLYLEKIELKGFKGFMHEMQMISYLLKNSMVLKKLSIQSFYSSVKKQSEISKKLLTFPRSSPECQIIFD